MVEVLTALLFLAAGLISYWFSCIWLGRIFARRVQVAVRISLALAAGLAAFDFTRPWVFPLACGLLIGSLLSTEFS